MGATLRYFPDGMHKKNTEIRWQSTKIGEQEIMLYRIALERHHCAATKAETIQSTEHCVLCLNADGPHKPLRQQQNSPKQ